MFRKSILASSLSLLLLPGGAWALGLGGIRPESALNQPFVGEIDLVGANPDELDAIKVTLAPDAEFAKRGIDRQQFLTKLRFKPQVSPRGKTVIRVTSAEPVREPYMDFLVDVVWPKGHMVKGFTVLLDPPVTSRRSPPPVTAAVASAPPTPRRAEEAPRASRPAPAVAAPVRSSTAVQPVAPPSGAGDFPLSTGPIKPGAGLWRTARKLAPPGATVAQTAMALYRNNQHAFAKGDINLLRQGEVLSIPSSAELFALDAAAAEAEYQSALAGQQVTAKPLTDVTAATADQGSRLKIAGRAIGASGDETAKNEPADSGGTMAQPDMERELLLVRETSESARQEADELRTRVQQLESHLADIQSLLTLRNAELARLQGAGEAVAGSSEAEVSDQPGAQGVPAEQAPVESDAASAGSEPLAERSDEGPVGTGEGTAPETSGLQSAPASEGEAASKVVAAPELPPAGPDLAEAARRELKGEAAEMPAKPDLATEPARAESDRTGKSWLDAVPLVGGVLKSVSTPVLWSFAVIGGMLGVLGWFSMRRRRALKESLGEFKFPSAPKLPDETTSVTAPVSETTDAFNEPELEEPAPTEDAVSALVDLDAPEEEPDESHVISEADIYIAYGRYSDAEGLLKQAIARSPRRADLRFKLADVYAGARNRDALAALMDDMQAEGMDQEQPEKWAKLAEVAKTASAERDGSAASTASVLGGVPQGRTSAETGKQAQAAQWEQNSEFDLSSPVLFGDDAPRTDRDNPEAGGHHAQGFDLALDDLTLPSSTTNEAATAESDANSVSRSQAADDTVTELAFGDLTVATDTDLTELGFPDGPKTPSPKTVGSVGDHGGDSAFAPIVDLDSQDIRGGTSPQSGAPDSAQVWSAPGSPPSSPESGVAMPRFELGPIEQDDGSSDLLSSQWEVEGGLWDEVGTKLDLGRAYVEMNDRAAAQSILNEVVEEGNPEQQAEARELLARLDGN